MNSAPRLWIDTGTLARAEHLFGIAPLERVRRSLRAIVDNDALGERLVTIDCDVLDADGGTRCAAISGGYVALYLACRRLVAEGLIEASPTKIAL